MQNLQNLQNLQKPTQKLRYAQKAAQFRNANAGK